MLSIENSARTLLSASTWQHIQKAALLQRCSYHFPISVFVGFQHPGMLLPIGLPYSSLFVLPNKPS